MPYSIDNVPTAVKNLPAAAQKLFIKVFNATLSDTNDEDKSRIAAWGAVKNKYKKEGDKWVRKASAKENVEASDNVEAVNFNMSLQEAEFDDDAKTATITVIKEGWSLNKTNGKRRYYTANAIESVADLLNGSKKMYKDHKERNRVRYIDEWAATVKESWAKDVNGIKEAKATIDFTANPKTKWLYEESKKHPKEVGVSIDGMGQLREGKIGTEDAMIVEAIKSLDSADFVTAAAAGGGVDKINESFNNKTLDILNEVFQSLDDRIKSKDENAKPYRDMDFAYMALYELISDLMWTNEVSDGDVNEEIDDALEAFGKRIKDAVGTIKSKQKQTEGKDRMKLEDFKKEHAEAYQELTEQIEILAKNSAEKAAQADLDAKKAEIEKVQNDLKEANEKLEKSEKELTDTKLKLDEYETKKKIDDKRQFIQKELEEAKIADKASETFINLLMKLEEADIKETIKDRADVINETEGKVKGLGAKPRVDEPQKPVIDADKEKTLLYNPKKR